MIEEIKYKVDRKVETVVLIMVIIGVVLLGLALSGYCTPLEDNSTEYEIEPVREIYYFKMFRDCFVFDDFSDYSEKFYTYPVPRPCFAIIEDGNVSLNFSEDYPSYIINCVVVSESEWINLQINHVDGFKYVEKADVGCFFEQSYLDLNKSFIDIYYVEKPLIIKV